MENNDQQDELLREGCKYLALGLPRAALFNFQEAIRLGPQSADSHCYAGTVLLRLGQHSQALQEFEEAAHLDPNNSGAYQGMADALRRQGDRTAQRRVLEYASQLAHESWRSHMILGDLAEAQRDYDGALAQYLAARESAPGVRGLLGCIGHGLLRMDRNSEAREALLQAVQEDPEEATAYYNLGICEQRLRHYADAYAAFHSAVGVNPHHTKAFAQLFGLDLRCGRWRSAWANFMMAIRLDVAAQEGGKAAS